MYALNRGYAQYREQSVMTASPAELVVMLYDSCLRQIRLAGYAMENNKTEDAHQALIKAEDVLTELMRSLDFQYQIANDLYQLYEYIYYELVKANAHKDPVLLGPVEELLQGLRGAWQEAGHQNRLSAAANGDVL
ncbi:MAG: flagellar export chaperone FliS [Clostridiaceae bacterium]|nr:flagellar export chaperone FliS [Clostridiaceae bacterium]